MERGVGQQVGQQVDGAALLVRIPEGPHGLQTRQNGAGGGLEQGLRHVQLHVIEAQQRRQPGPHHGPPVEKSW